MRVFGFIVLLVAGGILAGMLLFLARPRRGLPLYVQVEEGAENIEWLLTLLLRKASRRHLLLIDKTSGENKRILGALARRYNLENVEQPPPNAPLLYVRQGSTAQQLLAQYAALSASGKEKAVQGAK